jgi:VWFA-related protein
MNSLRQVVAAVCAILLMAPIAPTNGQEPQPPKPSAPPPAQQPATDTKNGQTVIKVPVNEVVIPVTVKDHGGGLVPDLTKNEFRVLEDNVEQRITYFRAEATPLSVVILLDNDLKEKDAEEVAKSIDAIVAGLSVSDEAFVCRFDQFFHEGKGFTTDQDKLLTELKRIRLDTRSDAPSQGGPFRDTPTINGQQVTGGPGHTGSTAVIKGQVTKALDDAVYNAAELLKERGSNRDRRRIIFLISDGRNGTKYNTNSYDTTVKQLLRIGVSVYSIAVGSAYFDRKFSRLVDYAHATGGGVFFAAKRQTMEELYSRVTEEARHQYLLAYMPTGTDRGSEYHSIEVRVKREGLTVIAREGYYTTGVPR